MSVGWAWGTRVFLEVWSGGRDWNTPVQQRSRADGRSARTTHLVAEMALVRAQLPALEPRAAALGVRAARGVLPLARARQPPRGVRGRAPGGRRPPPVRAQRVAHAARSRPDP